MTKYLLAALLACAPALAFGASLGAGICVVCPTTDTSVFVLKAGDTMTGQLTLDGSTLTVSGNAFSVGTSTFVVSGGLVGIGEIDPEVQLHITNANGSADRAKIRFERVDSSVSEGNTIGRIEFEGGENGTPNRVGVITLDADGNWSSTSSPTRIEFHTTASGLLSDDERMRIDNAGNVGIGTENPAQRIHMSSGTLLIDGDAATAFQVGASTFIINSSGQVGINSTSPDQDLHVDGDGATIKLGDNGLVWREASGGLNWNNAANTATFMELGISGDFSWNPNKIAVDFTLDSDNVDGIFIVDGSADRIGIGTLNPAQRLHITSGTLLIDGDAATAFQVGASTFIITRGGNVGIGATTPGIVGPALLEINGDDNNSGNIEGITIREASDSLATDPFVSQKKSGGSLATPTNTKTGMFTSFWGGGGHTGTAWTFSRGSMGTVACSNWTTSDNCTNIRFDVRKTDSSSRKRTWMLSTGELVIDTADFPPTPRGKLDVRLVDTDIFGIHVSSADESGIFNVGHNGRVGVGTTNPTEKLFVVGNASFTGIVTAESFDTSGSSYKLNGVTVIDANRNFIGNELSVSNNAIGADFTIETSTFVVKDGRVGIGTASPANKFHVVAIGNPAKFESTSGNGRIEIDAPSTKNAGVQFFENNVLKWGIFNQGTDDTLKFQNKDFATRLIIQQDGNVGIGTIGPSAQLELSNTVVGADFIVNTSTFIVTDGRVGIGTATPSKLLDVAGDVQFGCPANMTSFGRGCVSGVRTAGTWETVISDCRTTFTARICTYLDIQQACAAGAITSVGSTITWFGDHTGDNTVLVSFEDSCAANIDGTPEPTSNSRPGRCCL